MPGSNFIDARKLVFKPFQHPLHPPDETGDSGELEFATSKTAPDEQYIVKRGNTYPEMACNEFLYHKVTDALDMYTQNVRLIAGRKDYRRSAAIRYVPNAREFSLKTSTEDNFRAFFEFEALYVILNESDSHEYFLDEQERLFKLDNAASFTVHQTTIMLFDGNPIGRFFIPDVNAPLNAVGYDWYGLIHKNISKKHGDKAVEAYLSVIQRFADFDETVLYEAYGDLEKHYPKALCYYYNDFFRIRKKTCRKYLGEIGRI
jgi:hypothetical protein